MKKLLSYLCAAALALGAGLPLRARGAELNLAQSSGDGRLAHYSTAAAETYNYADLTFTGSSLRVARRAYQAQERPDQITVRQGATAKVEEEADWSYVSGASGYNATLDLSGLPGGSYTVEVRSYNTYPYVVATRSFTKDSAGCYFSKDNSTSKQYNFSLLQRLDDGLAPDDFTALKEMYTGAENEQVLAQMEARALGLTAGLESDREKAQAIYRWIVQNIANDADVAGDKYNTWIQSHPDDTARLDNPLHAFQQGYALCYGYARLTTLMMGYAGVDCVYITGRLAGDPATGNINNEIAGDALENLNHAWNAVKIDGAWYFLDTNLDALNYYASGSTTATRAPIFLHTFPSLNDLSVTHIGLRLGAKNYGTKLSPTAIPDGWQSGSSGLSYYVDGVKPRSTWAQLDGSTYYFNPSGTAVKGWQLIDGYWRYFDDASAMATGTQRIKEGSAELEYRFDSAGRLTANDWVTIQGVQRYFRGSEMLTGWQFLDDCWRYFDDTGALYRDAGTPLVLEDGTYTFNSQGALQTNGSGWVTLEGRQVYIDQAGLRTGLQDIDGNTYLLDDRGMMLTGWQQSDGKTLYFAEDGTRQTGWIFLEGAWYYADPQQGRLTGSQQVGGGSHYFDSQGRLSTGGWVDMDGTRLYYVDAKTKNGVTSGGKLVTGWKIVDGKLYYFDREDGRMRTQPGDMYNDNNQKWYTFDSQGVATLKQ